MIWDVVAKPYLVSIFRFFSGDTIDRQQATCLSNNLMQFNSNSQ